jgi:hypothetical protein
VLYRQEIPPSPLKNYIKNSSTLRSPFKVLHLSHIIFQPLQIPHIEPTTKAGVLLKHKAPPQPTGAHHTTPPTAPLLEQLQDPVILPGHTLVTAKSAEFKVTQPNGVLHFALYQSKIPLHPALHSRAHHGNHKLTLPPIHPPRHPGLWTVVRLTMSPQI